jgi:Mn-dependent DtxR family transcriptional regulator
MPRLTKLQGQYVAFIYYYMRVNGRPPAESEVQRYFGTTAPAVHDMILRLEKCGAIERVPWTARSIRVLVPTDEIPQLD